MSEGVVPLLLCRPVEWTPESLGKAYLPDMETPIYADSITGKCPTCDQAIYIGPRAQGFMLNSGEYQLACFRCGLDVAIAAGATTGGLTAVSLGATDPPIMRNREEPR